MAERFVVDIMLGKLAKWLRILGFDTQYARLKSQKQIEAYRSQGYILITRREKLRTQPRVYCLKADDPLEQLRDVVAQASITPRQVRPLQRCVLCNEQLQQTGQHEVFGKVPDYIFQTHTVFRQCPQCRRIYWPGSHPARMMQRLERALGWEPMESWGEDRGV